MQGDANLVSMKNMKDTFPGSNGKLYVNTYQLASIMPLDPNSKMVKDLERVTSISALPGDSDVLSKSDDAEKPSDKILRIDDDSEGGTYL